MTTYVVIPNYIVTDELVKLATNTINSFRKSSEVVIVAVDDGSPMDCKFLDDLSDVYIRNEKNSGFAITCNNGIRWIMENEPEDCFIVVANNDIEVYPGWLEAMQQPHLEYENVGVSGICHSQCKEIDGQHISKIRGSKITDGGLNGELMQDGGLLMVKKSVFEKVGLYDEQFIRGGYEDVDLFLRMRDTFGMKIIMSTRAWYWHKEGATRWNCETNGFINDFGRESKSIEIENLEKFINKWGYNPHQRQIWFSKEIVS